MAKVEGKAPRLPRAIVDLDDYTESVNILVYGDSGVGKTVLAGTAPNALILATEKGTISAKRQGSSAKMWKIKEWNDLVLAYEWLRDNPGVFDWVIIDTLTDMQQKALRAILLAAQVANPSRDPDIPAIQDHQKWQNMMKRFISDFNDLPCHVMWTAQTMRKEDEEGDDIVLPLLLGKNYEISAWACAQMHIVGYLGIKEKGKDKTPVRRLVTSMAPPYFAKDRYDVLGRWLDDPTMPQIISLIEEGGTEAAAKAREARNEDSHAVKAFKGTVEPDDEDDDDDDETTEPDEPDVVEDDADEEEEEEEPTPPARKAPAKKAAAKRTSKFRASTEEEE